MREIRTYGSEGGGAVSSPYPYRIRFMRQAQFFQSFPLPRGMVAWSAGPGGDHFPFCSRHWIPKLFSEFTVVTRFSR